MDVFFILRAAASDERRATSFKLQARKIKNYEDITLVVTVIFARRSKLVARCSILAAKKHLTC